MNVCHNMIGETNLIKEIDITNTSLAKQLLHVQIASYKVEADIIDFYEIPPLKDTIDTLQRCGETFYGFYADQELCGAISIKVKKSEMYILRLIVHPNHFKKGIASMLLDFVESNVNGVKTIVVTTGSKNIPAVNFYEKSGFLKVGEIKVEERLSLAVFKKKIDC